MIHSEKSFDPRSVIYMSFQEAPQLTSEPKHQVKQPSPIWNGVLLIKLPSLATVASLVVDRGFGFVQCESTKDEQFLHVTSALAGRRDFSGMEKGDLLLCQLGTNPRRPGQKSVVRWIHINDVDWGNQAQPASQGDLDAMRRGVLLNCSLKQLHQQLDAAWYAKLWDGNAPADLHDPVLAEAWCEHLSRLNPEMLRKESVGDRLKSCHFDFREKFDPASPLCSVNDLCCCALKIDQI
jgi:hypothetical protein